MRPSRGNGCSYRWKDGPLRGGGSSLIHYGNTAVDRDVHPSCAIRVDGCSHRTAIGRAAQFVAPRRNRQTEVVTVAHVALGEKPACSGEHVKRARDRAFQMSRRWWSPRYKQLSHQKAASDRRGGRRGCKVRRHRAKGGEIRIIVLNSEVG